MTGRLVIAGLGPGDAGLVTPDVTDTLATATDVLGYTPYVARVPDRAGLRKHPSDNRVELDRARHALSLAADGAQPVMVSSGDPGVFAMAAAVFEAVDADGDKWRDVQVDVLPGITAMLAAAARAGAPLGHDFCAINLSDNLKPWSLIERRLCLAVEADFAMAFYNPRSKSRPEQFGQALDVLRGHCADARPVIFARAVSTPDETITTVPLPDATPEMADMRTVVIVGSSQTRVIARNGAPYVYTPRSVLV
ncbi:MAG: precorrin-3B C(17)-methyltransferase [Pseudomonadota bacterium]